MFNQPLGYLRHDATIYRTTPGVIQRNVHCVVCRQPFKEDEPAVFYYLDQGVVNKSRNISDNTIVETEVPLMLRTSGLAHFHCAEGVDPEDGEKHERE